MNPSDELVLQAVRWKLGLNPSVDVGQMRTIWAQFSNRSDFREVAEAICRGIAYEMLETSLQSRLGILRESKNPRSPTELESMLETFARWIYDDETVRSPRLAGSIRKALRNTPMGAGPPAPGARAPAAPVHTRPPNVVDVPPELHSPRPRAAPVRTKPVVPPASGPPASGPPSSGPFPKPVPQPGSGGLASPPSPTNVPSLPESPPGTPNPMSQWKNLPPPSDEPDPHPEFDERHGKTPEGYSIVGACARGKKHKHEGTHCDDWFDFATSGAWTVLAVCDGGGSYKFSRVGARAASETAVQLLQERLAQHRLRQRTVWSAESFAEPDVQFVQEALVDSFTAAWQAVKSAAADRAESEAHRKVLGRALTVKDLYSTLLVAVHTTVKYGDAERSFVLGCAVGDGMLSVIDRNGVTRLLMTPDSGEHSGEVRFLDEREIEPSKLRAKINTFFGPLRALVLMTDGVADDYFPNDPGMSLLYGDLALNGILPVRATEDDIADALVKTNWRSLDEVVPSQFQSTLDQSSSDAESPIRLRSLAAFADRLGVPAQDVVGSLPLLAAGARGEPMCQETTPPGRLRVWLDSYHVRGSFDDRTLLILHR